MEFPLLKLLQPAPRKMRRRAEESDLARALREGWPAKLGVFALFLAGLAALLFTGGMSEPLTIYALSILVFLTAIFQLHINHPNTWHSNQRLLLVLACIFVQLALIKIIIRQAELGHISHSLAFLLAPYALAPLLLSVLLGKNIGLFAAVFASLWSGLIMGKLDAVLLVISLLSGFVAVFATVQVRRRSRLIRAGLYVGITTLLLGGAFGLIGPINWASLPATDWRAISWQCAAALGAGLLTAILVSGLLPALEILFGVTTDISWLEMSDLNHPLLRRLSLEAPGTYHHSMAVAQLSEAAAEKVGANPTICRVASYFHDIGKLVKPGYFTENMLHGVNPHDELTPTMSALIIIAHVKEGVDLALKHRLNPLIVQVIREHHGTSLVSYFYQRALSQQKDAALGGKIMNLRAEDVPQVDESSFRYPGPRPQTKESAIISLADAVESASRSLERPTPQRIEDLVHDIIHDRLEDGQLDDAPLTLAEISAIAKSFCFTLSSMLHSRTAYPSKRSPKDKDTTEAVSALSNTMPISQARLAAG